MKKKLYSMILVAAIALMFLGAVVLAQNAPKPDQPAQAEKQTTGRNCPMMGQMDMKHSDMGMDMSHVMDCCKKMPEHMKSGEKMGCPMMAEGSDIPARRPSSKPFKL